LTGRSLYLERIEFRHNRKSGNRELERFFGCQVTFGANENRILLKKSDLSIPLLTADDHLYRLLQRLSEAVLEAKKEAKPQFVVAVERAISDRLASGNATQAEVSKALGLSSRTLARRLAEQGTTFFRVVEGYRQAMAESLLLETEMQLTEIAFLLGYSDLSSFSTAFRRWTGHTPSERRKGRPVGPSY
jgi:AraC-like DNA-binding protein